MPSKVLGIDSSDDFLSVGLAGQEGIIVSRSSEPQAQNKNMLHSFLSELLAEAGTTLSEIDGVAVAIGPGSFTGLRVGLAVAKGLCWSLGIPLAGVSSLAPVAVVAGIENGRILAVKDAKRDEFYYAAFIKDSAGIQQVIPDSAGQVSEIEKLVAEGYLPVGPGAAELRRRLPNMAFKTGMGYARQALGGAIAVLGLEMILAGRTLELSSAVPHYIRAPKAKLWNR